MGEIPAGSRRPSQSPALHNAGDHGHGDKVPRNSETPCAPGRGIGLRIHQEVVTSEKTACKRCATAILQITAKLTEGYCMPCANATARAKEPVTEYVRQRNPEPILNHLHPEDGVILSVAYDPGWSPDLTSWTIQISGKGIVSQAVQWSRMRGARKELLESVTLEPLKLTKIHQLIVDCPPGGFQALKHAACIDDAANVSLIIPPKKIRIDLPYFHLAHDLKKGRRRFDDVQTSLFSLFGRIWSFADWHAPYSLSEHQKSQSRPGF